MTITEETNEEYHDDTKYVSRSMLFEFLQRPSVFHGKYIAKTIPKKAATDAMDLGTIIHSLTLEPQNEVIRFIPREIQSSDGKNTTKAAKEFVEQAKADKMYAVSLNDYTNRIKPAVESVEAELKKWIRPEDVREKSLRWENKQTGITCRCRPDLICFRQEMTIVIDLKTTGEVSDDGFFRSVKDYGYWLQQSHYTEGIQATYGIDTPVMFLFFVVETNAPHACRMYEIHPDDAAMADVVRIRLLEDLARRLDAEDWSDRGADKVVRVRVPRYCYNGLDNI